MPEEISQEDKSMIQLEAAIMVDISANVAKHMHRNTTALPTTSQPMHVDLKD